jgi:hypothetical protein
MSNFRVMFGLQFVCGDRRFVGVGIDELERELRAAGHEVEREYVMGELDTYDGDGWVVRVDGEVVASAASLGGLEDRLRRWKEGRR